MQDCKVFSSLDFSQFCYCCLLQKIMKGLPYMLAVSFTNSEDVLWTWVSYCYRKLKNIFKEIDGIT